MAEVEGEDEHRMSLVPQEANPNKLFIVEEVSAGIPASGRSHKMTLEDLQEEEDSIKTTRIAAADDFIGRESMRPNPGLEGYKHSPHSSP